MRDIRAINTIDIDTECKAMAFGISFIMMALFRLLRRPQHDKTLGHLLVACFVMLDAVQRNEES